MEGVKMLMPEDLVIDVSPLDSKVLKPFVLNFLEKPDFPVGSGLAIKASNVTSMITTGGNDVLDYNYDD